ncbi:hypothetical protein [Dankookia sp. P2]|uniref:hypothetical protein n=1 Tax=Dankookia sp. P2 TaxID=3423955 RepID=UPI003D679DA3
MIGYWQAELGPTARITHLSGFDLARKVAAIRNYDFFAAPGGTAAFIGFLADIPGVFYSHPGLEDHFTHQLAMFPSAKSISRGVARAAASVAGEFAYDWAGIGGESYSIPVDDFVREALIHYRSFGKGGGGT